MKVYIAHGIYWSENYTIVVGLSRDAVVKWLDRFNVEVYHVCEERRFGGWSRTCDCWVRNFTPNMRYDKTAMSHVGLDDGGYVLKAPDGRNVMPGGDWGGACTTIGDYLRVTISEHEVIDDSVLDLPKVDVGDDERGHYDVWE